MACIAHQNIKGDPKGVLILNPNGPFFNIINSNEKLIFGLSLHTNATRLLSAVNLPTVTTLHWKALLNLKEL